MASIFEQSELIFKKNEVKDLLLDAIWKNNHQKIQYIFNSHSDSYIQEILRSEYYNGRAIFDPDNLKRSAGIIKQIHQKADNNTHASWKDKGALGLLRNAIRQDSFEEIENMFNNNSRSKYYISRAVFDPYNLKGNAEVIEQIRQKADKNTYAFWKGKKTLNSLYYAVQQGSLKKVHEIFNSNSNSDIQKVLTDKVNNNYTILDYAISRSVVDIIKVFWQKANKDTRILLSDSAIKIAYNSLSSDVKKIILEIKNYRKQKRIEENCGIDTEKPTTKFVLQGAQLFKVNTNKARCTS